MIVPDSPLTGFLFFLAFRQEACSSQNIKPQQTLLAPNTCEVIMRLSRRRQTTRQKGRKTGQLDSWAMGSGVGGWQGQAAIVESRIFSPHLFVLSYLTYGSRKWKSRITSPRSQKKTLSILRPPSFFVPTWNGWSRPMEIGDITKFSLAPPRVTA